MLRSLSIYSIACSMIFLCGCQTWSNGGYPLQNVSRVPPPGTGTYQLPNGYYNNTTAVSPSGQVMTASATSDGLRPASGGLPTTTLNDFGNARSQVQQAQFTQPANAGQFAPSNMSGGTISNGGTTTFSDHLPDTSDLQWQP